MHCVLILLLALLIRSHICGCTRISTHIRPRNLDVDVAPLPLGVTLLGQAFDVTTLSLSTGGFVFDNQFEGAPRTQFSVLSFGEFSIPQNIYPTILNKRDVRANSISKYSEYRTSVAAELGLETNSASQVGSGSLEAASVGALLQSRDLVSVKQTWEVVDLVLGSFDGNGSVLLSKAFQESLAALPDFSRDQAAWRNFISNWGTHWVWRVVLGLTVEVQTDIEKCNSKLTNNLKDSITSLFLASTGQANSTDSLEDSSLLASSQWTATGGDITKCYDVNHCNWLEYITSLDRNNLGVIRVEISPIADVPINNKTITLNLREAVAQYLQDPSLGTQDNDSYDCSSPSRWSAAKIVAIVLGIMFLLAIAVLLFVIGKRFLHLLRPRVAGQAAEVKL